MRVPELQNFKLGSGVPQMHFSKHESRSEKLEIIYPRHDGGKDAPQKDTLCPKPALCLGALESRGAVEGLGVPPGAFHPKRDRA